MNSISPLSKIIRNNLSKDIINLDKSKFSSSYVSFKLFKKITFFLEKKKHKELKSFIQKISVSNLVDLLEFLNCENRRKVISFLKLPLSSDFLSKVNENIREDIIEVLGSQVITVALSKLESDEAVQMIEELDREYQNEILGSVSKRERCFLEESLSYPKDSVGRLMQREMVCITSIFNVSEALNYIYSDNYELPEDFHNIYVLNEDNCPVGVVSLSKLLISASHKIIKDIMNKNNVHKVSFNLDQEEVSRLFYRYGLVSVPVINKDGRIIGQVTLNDIVHVVKEEAEEDILNLSRISKVDFYADTWRTFYKRSPWLLITLINALITVSVINNFKASIEIITEITLFLPIAAMMGGNAGLQVVTVIVRSLTTRELRSNNFLKTIRKEIFVGLINGIFFSVLLGLIVGIYENSYVLSFVIGFSLIVNMIWSAFLGALLPISFNRFGIDPAVGSGPMLTVMTDFFGYGIYLLISSFCLVSLANIS